MSDMYIDVMYYIMEKGLSGFNLESDEDEVMEWLFEQGDEAVEDILEEMINEHR